MRALRILIEVFQYLLLIVILVVAAVLFQKTASPIARFLILCAVAISYVLWGVWHHWHKDRFNKHIFFEYVLVAALVIVLSALGMGIIRFL